MTPEPTPSVWMGLLNQSLAMALLVMPTTVGPTFFAARTTGVLRASEIFASEEDDVDGADDATPAAEFSPTGPKAQPAK